MDPLTRWIHVVATAVYLGSTLAVALVLLPAAAEIEDATTQRRVLARALRPYNVLSVGALGVLVISGASGLTDLKALLSQDFGRLLLINVATYFSFGLAHRLVRAELGRLPVEAAWQAGLIRRMRTAAWLGVGLAAWTAWAGLRLVR
jgi:hypothetical protein